MVISDIRRLIVAFCGECVGFEVRDLEVSLSHDDFKAAEYTVVFDIDEAESVSQAAEMLGWTHTEIRKSSNILYHQLPNGECVKTSLRFLPVIKG